MQVEHLRAILNYDPETGVLIWKERTPDTFRCVETERRRLSSRWNRTRAGTVAGCITSTGYRVLCIEGRTYRASRIAWALVHGDWPSGQIDHISHKRDDDRLKNLRDVTPMANARNKSLLRSNKSGAVGVHFHQPSGKWHARVMDRGRRIHLGAFDNLGDAVVARQAASARHDYHPNHGAA